MKNFFGKVDGEAIGVMQLENVRARENSLILPAECFYHLGEYLRALVYRLGEALLLGLYYLLAAAGITRKIPRWTLTKQILWDTISLTAIQKYSRL